MGILRLSDSIHWTVWTNQACACAVLVLRVLFGHLIPRKKYSDDDVRYHSSCPPKDPQFVGQDIQRYVGSLLFWFFIIEQILWHEAGTNTLQSCWLESGCLTENNPVGWSGIVQQPVTQGGVLERIRRTEYDGSVSILEDAMSDRFLWSLVFSGNKGIFEKCSSPLGIWGNQLGKNFVVWRSSVASLLS